MRKIKLVLILLLLIWLIPLSRSFADTTHDIHNFMIDINPILIKEKTKLEISWQTKKEIEDLKVYVQLSNGQEELSFVYSPNDGRDNLAIFEITYDETSKIPYQYLLIFEINIYKPGNFNLIFEYTMDEESYKYVNHVYTKTTIVDENTYSTKNAIVVGVIITIFAIFATYLILEASNKEFELREDDDVTSKNKTTRK